MEIPNFEENHLGIQFVERERERERSFMGGTVEELILDKGGSFMPEVQDILIRESNF